MAHGTPDWWGTAPQDTVYRLEDMAELAARLGSPVTYKRTGNVMFVDAFDSGLGGWTRVSSGAGYDLRVVTSPLNLGGYSVLMKPEAASGGWLRIKRSIPSPALSILGGEITFQPDANLGYILLSATYYDGSNYYPYRMKYDHVNGEVELFNSAAGYTVVGSPGSQFVSGRCFTSMKMTMDLVNVRYDWIYFNKHRYDGTVVSPASYASTEAPHLFIEIQVTNADTTATRIYVDNVIFTQNEPR